MSNNDLLEFLNVSNTTEIDDLGGSTIGEKTAEKIIEFRQQLPNKKFTSLEQLDEVDGVGKAKIEALLQARKTPNEPSEFVKSNTVFYFVGEAPRLSEYKGLYQLIKSKHQDLKFNQEKQASPNSKI